MIARPPSGAKPSRTRGSGNSDRRRRSRAPVDHDLAIPSTTSAVISREMPAFSATCCNPLPSRPVRKPSPALPRISTRSLHGIAASPPAALRSDSTRRSAHSRSGPGWRTSIPPARVSRNDPGGGVSGGQTQPSMTDGSGAFNGWPGPPHRRHSSGFEPARASPAGMTRRPASSRADRRRERARPARLRRLA